MSPCTAATPLTCSPRNCAGSILTRSTARHWQRSRLVSRRRSSPRPRRAQRTSCRRRAHRASCRRRAHRASCRRRAHRAERGSTIAIPQILIHQDGELLAKAVAARLVTRLVDAVAAKGRAHLVLTGGGIGTRVLAELAVAPARDAVDWRRVEVWWGDERFLPAGHPERNETGARSALLDHVDVVPERVHPMPGPDGRDGPNPEAAADRYSAELR